MPARAALRRIGEQGARLAGILLDLAAQGVQRFKAPLRAEKRQEIHLYVTAIDILLEVEQMYFQLIAHAVHRGTAADIGHPRYELRSDPVHDDGIHPGQRRDAPM